MKKRNFIILLIVIIFIFIGCGESKSTNVKGVQLTQKEKVADFEYMYNILNENYPYFEVNKRLNGVDWLQKKNSYIDRIKSTNSDNDFFNVLQSILAELNNGHAHMIDKNFYLKAKSFYETDAKINQEWIKQLNNSKAIARYSTMPDIGSRSQISSNNIIPNNVKTDIVVKEKVAYLAINSFNSFNIEGDMKIIKPYLKSIKDYKALIIDIRGNDGGDSRYWSDNIVPMLLNKPVEDKQYIAVRGGSLTEQFFISRTGFGYEKFNKISSIDKENLKNIPPELKADFKYYRKDLINCEPKDSVGFKGKIYLLVDGDVFSSSEALATFAKSTGFATLVGEKTGGDGIGDDPAICVLPNSGYCFNFTKEMGLTSDGTCNFEHKTEPDIKVSAKINLDIPNDEAVKAVLKLIN